MNQESRFNESQNELYLLKKQYRSLKKMALVNLFIMIPCLCTLGFLFYAKVTPMFHARSTASSLSHSLDKTTRYHFDVSSKIVQHIALTGSDNFSPAMQNIKLIRHLRNPRDPQLLTSIANPISQMQSAQPSLNRPKKVVKISQAPLRKPKVTLVNDQVSKPTPKPIKVAMIKPPPSKPVAKKSPVPLAQDDPVFDFMMNIDKTLKSMRLGFVYRSSGNRYTIHFKDNLFKNGSFNLEAAVSQRIKKVIGKIKLLKREVGIAIVGHSDMRPIQSSELKKKAISNQNLSKLRAETVKNMFFQDSFATENISTLGLGNKSRNTRSFSVRLSIAQQSQL